MATRRIKTTRAGLQKSRKPSANYKQKRFEGTRPTAGAARVGGPEVDIF